MMSLRILAPAPFDRHIGAHRYHRGIVEALRADGQSARIEQLAGRFPDPDPNAIQALHDAIAAGGDEPIVLDGFAAAALAYVDPTRLAGPVPLLLVHHLFTDDPDLAPPLREWLGRAERSAFLHTPGIIATSGWMGQRLTELGVHPDRVRVVEPGTAPATIVRGSQGPGVRLLALGDIIPRKGHDVLIEALAQLGERDWNCRIVGSRRHAPEYARGLDVRARALGIARHIEWRGEVGRSAPDVAWEDIDALVVPAHYSGYAVVVAEALVRGVPVVATTGGALAETLPADCGWSVPPGDSTALAEALAELIDQPGRRAARARAARRAGEALPGWPEQAHRFTRAIEALTHPDQRAAG